MIVRPHPETHKNFEPLYKRVFQLLDDPFEIAILCDDPVNANAALDAAGEEINRIGKLLSPSHEHSDVNRINAGAGICAVKINHEVYNLISRSLKISTLTQGAFDISFDSIDKQLLLSAGKTGSSKDDVIAASAVRLINHKNIILNNKNGSVYLRRKGMRISFGRMCKGYAADKTKELLQSLNIANGTMNIDGNLLAWGKRTDEIPWTASIVDPGQDRLPFSNFPLIDMAINTLCNHKPTSLKYPHECVKRLDPRTGFAVRGMQLVSVVCPSAELAETMATTVMILGIREGLRLINQLKAIACIIIDEEEQIHCSQNISMSNLEKYE